LSTPAIAAIRDRFENAGEVVDLGVAMLDLSRDGSGTENASVADHLSAGVVFDRTTKA
jgi:hypothetical protein